MEPYCIKVVFFLKWCPDSPTQFTELTDREKELLRTFKGKLEIGVEI